MANILKTPAGTYRARVQLYGVRKSKNFKRKKDAVQWVTAMLGFD